MIREIEVLRRFKAMQRGTRVGKISIENEADTVIPGKKRITDETRPKCRMQNAEWGMKRKGSER